MAKLPLKNAILTQMANLAKICLRQFFCRFAVREFLDITEQALINERALLFPKFQCSL